MGFEKKRFFLWNNDKKSVKISLILVNFEFLVDVLYFVLLMRKWETEGLSKLTTEFIPYTTSRSQKNLPIFWIIGHFSKKRQFFEKSAIFFNGSFFEKSTNFWKIGHFLKNRPFLKKSDFWKISVFLKNQYFWKIGLSYFRR